MVRLSKKSSVEWQGGTEGVPLNSFAYRVHNLNMSPESAVVNPNPSFVGAFQSGPARPGGRFMTPSFSTEFRGSDVADVPPPDGALLRACAFVETENGTTPNMSFKYALGDLHDATGNPEGDVYPINLVFMQDGLRKRASSCVGSPTFNFIAGQVPTIDYTWRGIVVPGTKGYITAEPNAFSAGALPRPMENSSLAVTIARTGIVTGTTTGTTSTTVLIDDTATFISDGLYAGDAIELDSGGETAVIISVDSQIQITSDTLSGAGFYDNGEDYTITRATSYSTASGELQVPSITYAVNNVIDPNPDVNGEEGFSNPNITSRAPVITMVLAFPQLYDLNPEYAFIEGETLDIEFKHEVGGGDRHEATMKMSAVINSMPVVSEQNGKLIYTLTMDQNIESGDDPFSVSWQGT